MNAATTSPATPAPRSRKPRATPAPAPRGTTYRLPSTYTAGQLATLYRHAIANPADMFVTREYGAVPMTAAQLLAWFRRCLHAKINRETPAPRGRKDTEGWQRAAREIARRMRERIVTRIGDCPPELRARLAHRLYTNDDF